MLPVTTTTIAPKVTAIIAICVSFFVRSRTGVTLSHPTDTTTTTTISPVLTAVGAHLHCAGSRGRVPPQPRLQNQRLLVDGAQMSTNQERPAPLSQLGESPLVVPEEPRWRSKMVTPQHLEVHRTHDCKKD